MKSSFERVTKQFDSSFRELQLLIVHVLEADLITGSPNSQLSHLFAGSVNGGMTVLKCDMSVQWCTV